MLQAPSPRCCSCSKLPDGTVKVLVEELHRATIEKYLQTVDYFEAEANILEEPADDPVEIEALAVRHRPNSRAM